MQTASEKYFGIHANALELRARRMELIASNIANAATPGYKARDLDFSSALARAETGGALAATAPRHFAFAASANPASPGFRLPVTPSLDGNTVELATEQALFGENAARYQTTLGFLNGRIGQLMAALKGD